MAELTMLADIQRAVYPEEVTRQLRVIAQARPSSPVIHTLFFQMFQKSFKVVFSHRFVGNSFISFFAP